MTARPVRSHVLPLVILAVLGLPYAAPAICGLTGALHQPDDPPTGDCDQSTTPASGMGAIAPPGMPHGPCDFGRCSATLVAPTVVAAPEIPALSVVALQIPSPLPRFDGDPPTPLTPPPQG